MSAVAATALESELGAVPVWRSVSELVLMMGKPTALLLTSYDLCISGRAVLAAVVLAEWSERSEVESPSDLTVVDIIPYIMVSWSGVVLVSWSGVLVLWLEEAVGVVEWPVG